MRHHRILLAGVLAAVVAGAGAYAQSDSQEEASGPPAVTELQMMAAAVPSSDLDRSIAFYTNGLGMTSAGRIEMGRVTEAPLMFPGSGTYLMLQKPTAEDAALPVRAALNRIILAVPDLKALEAKLKAAGYQLNGPINEQSKYHVAVGMVQDPDGNYIELVQRLP